MSTSKALARKLVLITGASGGIGRATALTLAKHGCSIAVHYNTAKSKADELVDQLKDQKVNAIAFQADLSQYESARKLHADVVSEMGPIDVLYNNCGVTNTVIGPQGDIQDISIEEFEKTWRTNAAASFILTQLSLPHMLEQKWGRIIYCASVAAGTGGVVGPHYASSKSAIHGLMHWASMRSAKDGVTVNAVSPMLIGGTTMMANVPQEFTSLIPIGRFGHTQEVASVVEMLALNAFMTNKIIVVDGGMTPSAF